ncbi:MAG: phage shock protein PspA [SAR86 cluster bacterium]|uniref:Phage shock protein PspA n=1 Tax=SAR86 cluster bacterium TaxID=2030880 RepID=A0A2A5CHE9_9GAMM|nr:MAG: phage shock protein PspA [SAR86 cluster bacterium]
MGIFSRLSDIVNSNINAMLDKAEDPERMIRMVIQEMEETLVEVRSTTARIIADKKELVRRNKRMEKQAEDWESKAELAINKGREDLAKAALLEKTAVNEMISFLHEDMDKLDSALDQLSLEIEQLQSKLNEARARQKTILMRHDATSSRRTVNAKLYDGSVDKAINKFEHYERKIEHMESEIEAYEISGKNIEAEFAALEREGKIDEELANLKARIEKKSSQNK